MLFVLPMRITGWLTVGLFYFLLVLRNYLNSTGAVLNCPNWPFCLTSMTPGEGTLIFLASLFLFSGLILLATVITWDHPVIKTTPPKIKRLAIAGIVGLFIQFLLGSQVRQWGAGLACPNFPNCLDSFTPHPWTHVTGLAFMHRWWGFLLLGHFFHLAFAAARTAPELAGPTRRIFALSVAQVFLGIGTVLSGLHSESRVLHAAVGYALWGMLFFVMIRAGGARWTWRPFIAESANS